MPNGEATYEQIDRYLDGKMQDDELRAFEAKMAQNVSFQEEVIAFQEAREAIVDYNLLTLKAKMQDYTPSGTRQWKKWGFGGLLLFALVSGIALWPSSEEPSLLVNKDIVDPKAPILIEEKPSAPITEPQSESNGHTPKINTKANDTINKIDLKHEHPVPTILNQNPPPEVVNDTTFKDSTPSYADTDSYSDDDTFSCADFSLDIQLNKKNTCKGLSEGTVEVTNVSGGSGPYSYSLDADLYNSTGFFERLGAGSYTLVVKDQNSCVDIKDITIIAEMCGPDFVKAFNPDAGEKWEIPYDSENAGVLKIVNRKGQTVYSASFQSKNPAHWAGMSSSGESLPMGYYIFELIYDNGKKYGGGVSIVR